MPQIINTYYLPCKRFALACGYYGILQSFFWFTTSIVLIIYPVYFNMVQRSWKNPYDVYIYEDGRLSYFYYSMCFECAMSLCWLFSSTYMVLRIYQNKIPYPQTEKTKYACIIWAVVVFVQSTLDLFLTATLVGQSLMLPIQSKLNHFKISYITYIRDSLKDVASVNIIDEQPDKFFNLKFLLSSRFIIFWYINVLMAGILFALPYATVIGKTKSKSKYIQYQTDDDDSIQSIISKKSSTKAILFSNLKKCFRN